MEELTSILGIVVAAGILLAKLFIREKTGGANGKTNSGDEAWPAAGQQPATARPKAEPARMREESVSEPTVRKTTAPRENGRKSYREDRYREDRQENRRPGKKPSAATQTPERRPSGVPAEVRRQDPHVPAEEFDLRRAIVYSEILRPKFDE